MSKQISYMALIGVHSTVHLMHPNQCHVTTTYMYKYTVFLLHTNSNHMHDISHAYSMLTVATLSVWYILHLAAYYSSERVQ